MKARLFKTNDGQIGRYIIPRSISNVAIPVYPIQRGMLRISLVQICIENTQRKKRKQVYLEHQHDILLVTLLILLDLEVEPVLCTSFPTNPCIYHNYMLLVYITRINQVQSNDESFQSILKRTQQWDTRTSVIVCMPSAPPIITLAVYSIDVETIYPHGEIKTNPVHPKKSNKTERN